MEFNVILYWSPEKKFWYYSINTKCTMFWNCKINFTVTKTISRTKKQSSLGCKSISPPKKSILYRTTFHCNCSCKCFCCTVCLYTFAHLQTESLPILHIIISGAWSDWMEIICEQQFSSLATDTQLDLGLGFDCGNSNTLICFQLNNSIVDLHV